VPSLKQAVCARQAFNDLGKLLIVEQKRRKRIVEAELIDRLLKEGLHVSGGGRP